MFELAVLMMLVLLSGVFSGAETALVSLSVARVDALLREGRSGAHALYRLKQDPSRMLTTILIGNNLVNIAASAMATVMATRWFGHAGPGIAVGALTVIILVFGEITPKSLATRYAERISLFIAMPMLGFMRLIYPFVWMFGHLTTWVYHLTGGQGDPTVTESEVISMLGYGEQEGTIEHNERKLIERVFAFNDLCARDVMTPQGRIFALDGNLTVGAALPQVTGGSFSRIPLYDRHPGDLKKVLFLRDLLDVVAAGKLDTRLDEIGHDMLYVPQQQMIAELFHQLRKASRHFAGVVDEYGTVRGIVTMEDLLEELVGEIYDETDVAPQELERISEHEISVEGITELRRVEEYFGIDLPGKPTDTVGFWVLSHIEYIPREQEAFSIDGLEVTIVRASNRRIERVRLCRPVADS